MNRKSRVTPAWPLLALDPGTESTAFCHWDPDKKKVIATGIKPNDEVVELLVKMKKDNPHQVLVVEMIKSYGNALGDSVLETCVWIGRFIAAWGKWGQVERLPRKTIVTHLCNNPRANDSNVRQELINRFGGKEKAIGKKKTPGPLYKLRGDMWAALAVAITYQELCNLENKGVPTYLSQKQEVWHATRRT